MSNAPFTLSLHILAKQMVMMDKFGKDATIGDYSWKASKVGAACAHGDHEDPECEHSGCRCACHG